MFPGLFCLREDALSGIQAAFDRCKAMVHGTVQSTKKVQFREMEEGNDVKNVFLFMYLFDI